MTIKETIHHYPSNIETQKTDYTPFEEENQSQQSQNSQENHPWFGQDVMETHPDANLDPKPKQENLSQITLSPSSADAIALKMSELEKVIQEALSIDASDMELERFMALVIKVISATNQSEKKLSKTESQKLKDARDYDLKRSLDGYRSRGVMAISITSGALHLASAGAHVAPSQALGAAGQLNQRTGKNLIQVSHLSTSSPEEIAKVTQHFSSILGSLAQASSSAQNTCQLQNQGITTEAQGKSESEKLGQQEADQDARQKANSTEEAKRTRQQVEDSRHNTFIALVRG